MSMEKKWIKYIERLLKQLMKWFQKNGESFVLRSNIRNRWRNLLFYNTLEDEQSYKYSLEIPYEYEIDKEYYKLKDRNLFELSDKLRKVFKDNQQELWYSFTLSLDSNGKLKVYYDYTNWFDTDYSFDEQLVIWEYKYLGTEPDDSESKDLISRYLDEYPNNPI